VLRAFGNSIFGVAAASAAGTSKISYAVCGQRVVIVRQISFVGPAPHESAISNPAKTAKAGTALRDLAEMHAERAADAIGYPGRVQR
jgi:hypothetical protein